MAKDIYLVAHGQSQHHVQGLVGGWYDTDLTDLGQRQADAVARRISELVGDQSPVEIYSSDLRRAAQTAAPIARVFNSDVTHLSDLRERSYGQAGGRPEAWLEERTVYAPKEGNRLDHRDGIEDAETKREFATRIYRAMDQIAHSPCSTQIVVTHGYAVTFAIVAWIRMPLDAVGWVNFKSGAAGLSHLREDDRWFNRNLLSLNDRAHLAGLEGT